MRQGDAKCACFEGMRERAHCKGDDKMIEMLVSGELELSSRSRAG